MKNKFVKNDKSKISEAGKLIIFDYDGVLRSISIEGIFRGYVAVLEYAGKNYKEFFADIEEFKKWLNPDVHKNIERVGIRKKDPEILRVFHSHYDAHVRIFPWAGKLLAELCLRHTLALFTSSSEKSVRESLGKLNDFFSLIICNDHVQKLKPDPEGIYVILEKLQRKNNNTLIIGDTTVDIMAGQSAGIQTGAVGWGVINNLEDLLKLNPDFVFREPNDLFSI